METAATTAVMSSPGGFSSIRAAASPVPAAAVPLLPKAGFRSVVLNFTPSWFSVNMGIGIVSVVLHTAPHRFQGQLVVATVLYVLNIAVFAVVLTLSLLRYALFPWVWRRMLQHPVQSLFLGTLPMGLATIVNATVLIAVPAYGYWAVELSWALWWLDVLLTVACCFGVPIVMFHVHALTLDKMTAAWLLPVVPAVVCAASGALVSTVLTPERALLTLLLSYALWGLGLCLSLLIMAIYLLRLSLHKLPTADVIVSAFLPLGPLGQGAFGLIEMAQSGRTVFPAVGAFSGTASAADTVFVCSTVVGLLLWGIGCWWLVHGASSVLLRLREEGGLRPSMGFWGFVFPIGVFTAATIAIGNALPSAFFDYLAVVLEVALVLLFLFVAACTVHGAVDGSLLLAPCLSPLYALQTAEKKAVEGLTADSALEEQTQTQQAGQVALLCVTDAHCEQDASSAV